MGVIVPVPAPHRHTRLTGDLLYVPITELTGILADLDEILGCRGADESLDWVLGLTTASRAVRERLAALGVAAP